MSRSRPTTPSPSCFPTAPPSAGGQSDGGGAAVDNAVDGDAANEDLGDFQFGTVAAEED